MVIMSSESWFHVSLFEYIVASTRKHTGAGLAKLFVVKNNSVCFYFEKKNMQIFVFSVLVTLVSSQIASEEPYLISNTFTAPTTEAEQFTAKPTDGATVLFDKRGRRCQCLLYYQCESEDTGDLNTNDYLLITRDEEPCNHYLEVCCATPKDPAKWPQPDPAKVKGCGYRNPKGFGRTEKHASTQFGEFPWVVALLDSYNASYAGAGVVISPEVVMTVGHIAAKFAPGALKVRAGEWDTQTTNEIFKHQEREVQDIYVHEEFNKKNLYNDIALLRLARPLVLTEHINAICLPEQDEKFDYDENCIANGWGKALFGREGRYAVILDKGELNMVTHSQCEYLLKRTRLGTRFHLHDSFVCASEDHRDSCKGDGGAPLACPIDSNRYILTGLVAWGIGCGRENIPAVYTNVPKFRRWVDTRMENWGLPAVKSV